ncbi:MAG: YeeE/YedE family protein [Rhodobacteraceae bacterium]|nr:YeeE/YedE family protein [Paracoccaceae bacterium]
MIDVLRDSILENPASYMMFGGLLIGTLLGFVVYRTNFCAMGSVSDLVNFGDWRRFRSWVLAGATAIIGVFILNKMGVMNPRDSIFLTPMFTWIGFVSGGFIFGVGMVLSAGCVSRNLVRAGSGDLRSVLVLVVIGIFAFMTIGGLLGPLRVWFVGIGTTDLSDAGMAGQGLGDLLGALTGLEVAQANLYAFIGMAGLMLGYIFMNKKFRASPVHIIAGVSIGLLATAGWMLTGLAQDDFADVPVALTSLTFVQPSGATVDYLMRFTAYSTMAFPVAVVFGTILGGFLGAASKKELQLRTFNGEADTARNIVGAAMMGIGGVLALGCTIGQGVTGVSTLAMGSFITFAFLVIGGVVGMKVMEWTA